MGHILMQKFLKTSACRSLSQSRQRALLRHTDHSLAVLR